MASIAKIKPGLGRDVAINKITIDKIERILSDTIRVNECWLRLNPSRTGYTYSRIATVRYPTHRIIKMATLGRNFPELVVDHLCRNRSCIRPSHLELVSPVENMKRGLIDYVYVLKSHCKYGHSMDDALIGTRKGGKRSRACRQCHARVERERRARLRSA